MEIQQKQRVISVFNRVTGKKIGDIDFNNHEAVKKLALDSIQFVELFAALELEFGIELPLKMMNVENAGEFLEKLATELQKQAA